MLPDTLVKLASFGTSGVCVLVVFWCGRTITRLGPEPPRAVIQLYRHYLLLCAFIAVVSALTGFVIARSNEQQTKHLLTAMEESKRSFEALKAEADTISKRLKDAETVSPTNPPKVSPDVARELNKAATNVDREAAKAVKNIEKSNDWVKKRLGIKF